MIKSKNDILISIIFIALIGLSLLLYPAVSQWVNENYQSSVCVEYSDVVSRMDDDTTEDEIHKAEEYNDDLTESVELLDNPFMQADSVDNADYGDILNATTDGGMAYIMTNERNLAPVPPSIGYYDSIEEGFKQNRLPRSELRQALKKVRQEYEVFNQQRKRQQER